jgi:hypothetical protein
VPDGDNYKIKKIFAARHGMLKLVRLARCYRQRGDYRLAVNGVPLFHSQNLILIHGSFNKTVELTYNSSPSNNAKTAVKTMDSEYRLRNLAWIGTYASKGSNKW